MVIAPFRVTGQGNRTRLTAFFSHFFQPQDMTPANDENLWKQIISRVADEWEILPASEKNWATEHVRKVIDLQEQLHRLFLDVGGADLCRACDGDCCGHGKFHPTLVNLLACLVTSHTLPEPDFSQTCPYIGETGCHFPPGLRPYNCISFICEQVEDRLDKPSQETFYRLEKQIRAHYELFAERYTGASLRGVMIRGEMLPSYLARR